MRFIAAMVDLGAALGDLAIQRADQRARTRVDGRAPSAGRNDGQRDERDDR
jgi:hypothetical protein